MPAEPPRANPSSPPGPAAVRARALTKRFGPRTAVDSLDLEVPAGSVFGLIGPNGAGKSTTMRMLIDVLRPTSGTVEVLGEDPRLGGPALRRRIGYLPGEVTLPAGRGRDVLAHLAALSGDPSALDHGREIAARLGADLERPLRTLSKGSKQKIAIVQAFMHRPELLLLDEPTSGLDPLVQQVFLELVREARDAGATVFLSSHVLSEIQHVADRAAVLRDGSLVTVASVEELRHRTRREISARLRADTDEVRDALAADPALRALRVEAAPSGETVDGPAACLLVGVLEGGVDALVKTLARFPVEELSCQEQDLERSVLSMYRSRTEARSEGE